ncbi:hypothetical protein Mal48_00310 [Thalassoglobus polymorphus]|uniref:Uncharacterized protein n=1 Tax=Thalassoglobus polymorphus TaxID=2527994 RepID=A0A517QGP8_9PLAN|nr:hypothetical protein Mal48_00310 [Thalassoglobus polymorphus]
MFYVILTSFLEISEVRPDSRTIELVFELDFVSQRIVTFEITAVESVTVEHC